MDAASVIVFPGSNCERDIVVALDKVLPQPSRRVWHTETSLPKSSLIVLPGGFSFGDYLRPAALARSSPVMQAVFAEAKRGTPILGICNGFQILCETGLLDGILLRNQNMQFICRLVEVEILQARTPFTQHYKQNETLRLPIAHKDGNYFANKETRQRLAGEGQIVLRYTGTAPNGACDNIAGISDTTGRIVGMMPHPERFADPALGGTDGARFFTSLLDSLQ